MRDASVQSARHRVRLGVEQRILRGDFHSGTKLKQLRLAEEFGVGQGVVREALIELESMGLVESVDNRGVYVTQIDGKKLIDSLEVRAAIEGMAVRLCCDRCSRADWRQLRGMAAEVYELIQRGADAEGAALDRDFHHELVRLSRNSELLRVTDSYLAFGKIMQLDRDPQVVREEHFGILDAIEDGNADTAQRLLWEHLWAAKTVLEEKLRSDPDFVPQWVT